MTDLPAGPISPRARQATVDRLCAHFAADHLETAEFERRLDLVYAARTTAELEALERDLPAELPDTVTSPGEPRLPSATVDPTLSVKDADSVFTVFATAERKERWTPPRHLTSVTVFGETTLDFREAVLASREVRLTLHAVLSSTTVIVPPGMHVESSGSAILGEFAYAAGREAASDAPTLRIDGLSILAEVKIEERLPGETGKEARKRLKREKKAKRLTGE